MITVRPSRPAALLAAATMLAALFAVGLPGTAHAAFCDGQVGAVTWDGGAGTNNWAHPANWSTDAEPQDVYVCLDTTHPVVLDGNPDGVQANLRGIDIAAGTTLRIEDNGKLYAHGPQRSFVRPGATVQLVAGSLGGTGQIDLGGRLLWRATAGGGSTITSRNCGVANTCATAVQDDPNPGPSARNTPGLLRVLNSGSVVIDRRGVNLHDQYRLVVHGTVTLSGEGYVAAQDGTGIALRPKLAGQSGAGRLAFANNGGWYEGTFTQDSNPQPPSTFVNEGLLLKSGGTGTSLVDASYSRVGAGAAQVSTGVLRLPGGAAQPVRVAPSRAVGTGDCVGAGTYGCGSTTTGTDWQNTTVRTPGATVDRDGATITLREGARQPRVTGLGAPVTVHATGMRATRRAPTRMEMRYDKTELDGRGWRSIDVLRQATGTSGYRVVPRCLSDGRIPARSVACVDRRNIARTSSRNLADGDVVMVVRTIAFSRWCGR